MTDIKDKEDALNQLATLKDLIESGDDASFSIVIVANGEVFTAFQLDKDIITLVGGMELLKQQISVGVINGIGK